MNCCTEVASAQKTLRGKLHCRRDGIPCSIFIKSSLTRMSVACDVDQIKPHNCKRLTVLDCQQSNWQVSSNVDQSHMALEMNIT